MADPRRIEAMELLRLVRGWSQRQLADAADVRGGWLAEHERGERELEPEVERRLVAAMGYPEDARSVTDSEPQRAILVKVDHDRRLASYDVETFWA